MEVVLIKSFNSREQNKSQYCSKSLRPWLVIDRWRSSSWTACLKCKMARKLAKLVVIILMACWSAAVVEGILNGTDTSGNGQLLLRKKRFLLFPVNANLLVS